MFKIDIDDSVVVKQKNALKAALSSNPATERKIREMVRKVLKEAREKIIKNVHFSNGDSRQSLLAIRRITYKKNLGRQRLHLHSAKGLGGRAHGNFSLRPTGHLQLPIQSLIIQRTHPHSTL